MRLMATCLISCVLGLASAGFAENTDSFANERQRTDRVPWNNSADESAGPVVAFVGEVIFVEKRNLELTEQVTLPDGTTHTRKIPRMANRFELRYKVIETIAGDYTGSEIDFESFKHNGAPYFPKFNPVGLFVINRDGKWVLGQSSVFLPRETTDGDWAICGNLAGPEWSEELQALAASYEEPIGFLDIPKTQAAAEACVSGTRAANIFAFKEEVHFAPRRRKVACNREMAERDSLIVGAGSALDAEFKARDHAACVSRLEAEDNL